MTSERSTRISLKRQHLLCAAAYRELSHLTSSGLKSCWTISLTWSKTASYTRMWKNTRQPYVVKWLHWTTQHTQFLSIFIVWISEKQIPHAAVRYEWQGGHTNQQTADWYGSGSAIQLALRNESTNLFKTKILFTSQSKLINEATANRMYEQHFVVDVCCNRCDHFCCGIIGHLLWDF